jgi:hypothetical protein
MGTTSLANNYTKRSPYICRYGSNTIHAQMLLHDQWVTPEIAVATHPDKGIRTNSIFIYLNSMSER